MAAGHLTPASAPRLSGETARPAVSVWVLIDALGWRCLDGADFLGDLLPYRTPLQTILGFSSGAIPAILTGLQPSRNGHWNLFYYDPQGSPFRWLRPFLFLPRPLLDHRVTRKLMKELGRRVLGLGPLFECNVSPRLLPWFNWVEKANIYAPGGVAPSASIFDRLREQGTPFQVYSYHTLTDAQILERAPRDIESGNARFYFLYLSQLDHHLHLHCGQPEKLRDQLEWYAAGLRQVFRAAKKADPEMSFTVFSDHGMTPVRERYDLVREMDALGFSMPDDYLAVYDSTMARFWFFNDAARAAITGRLSGLACGRLLADGELEQLGILFPDRRYGELIFLLHPGWLLARSDFNGRGWNPAGMHGYHPDDPYSDAVYLSNRQPRQAMRGIADIHECMRHAMEAK